MSIGGLVIAALQRNVVLIFLMIAAFSMVGPKASAMGSCSERCKEDRRSLSELRIGDSGAPASPLTLPIAHRRCGSTGIAFCLKLRVVRRGQVAAARLVNHEKRTVAYGLAFAVQRRHSTGWRRDPVSPDGPWRQVRRSLRPGRASRYFRLRVPPQQPRGRYRFVTKVYLGIGSQGRTVTRHSRPFLVR